MKFCPDSVQRYFEEHYNNIFITGQRNYKECDICEAIETTIKLLGYKIDYRFDQKSPNAIEVKATK